jgi:hypothetical protein
METWKWQAGRQSLRKPKVCSRPGIGAMITGFIDNLRWYPRQDNHDLPNKSADLSTKMQISNKI